MGIFENLTNDSFEEQRDTLGKFSVLESDVYDAVIKVAFAQTAASGAVGVTVIAKVDNDEYRETIYITNRNKENFYYTKGNPPKKMPLMGFTTINDICQITCGKSLSQMETENKMIMLYNADLQKEVPTAVPVLMELVGKPIKLGILKELKYKVQNTDAGYVETDDVRESNVINKVFDPETGRTVYEINHDLKEAPLFIDKWLEKNRGIVIDLTKKSGNGNTTKNGKPVPPSKTEHKSLFT